MPEHLTETDIERARAIAAQAPPPSRETVGRVVAIMERAVRRHLPREVTRLRKAVQAHREDAREARGYAFPDVTERRDEALWGVLDA